MAPPNRSARVILFCIFFSAQAFAQMGVPTPNLSSPSTPSAPKSSSKSVAPAAIIGGIVAGATILYVATRGHGHGRSYILGCVTPSSDGTKMTDEKDNKTYALLASKGLNLSRGERLKLYGKKIKSSGKLIFVARELADDYGACAP